MATKATLISSTTTTGAQGGVGTIPVTGATFQASGSMSSGTGSATVNIEVSNDNTNWLTLGTLSLSLSTTPSTDGFTSNAPWAFVRANVTALSVNGTVSVYMGV